MSDALVLIKDPPRYAISTEDYQKCGEIEYTSLPAIPKSTIAWHTYIALWIYQQAQELSRHIVVNFFGYRNGYLFPPNSVEDVAYRIVVIVSHLVIEGCMFLLRTENKPLESKTLNDFFSPEINLNHFQQESALDDSKVPKTIQVRNLLTLFDQIVIRDNERGSLRDRLERFVNNVENCTPRLGTPPAYKPEEVEVFYQHINAAIRLSLEKLEKNPNPDSLYALVSALADAGDMCGARYTAEATMHYNRICGETALCEKTLAQTLAQKLAYKRLEIAQLFAATTSQKIFGFDVGGSSHTYTNYMQHMGRLVGLPGTKGVIETLATSFDTYLHLERFGNAYSVQVVIKTLQDEIKKSQSLREQLQKWIDKQIGDWGTRYQKQHLEKLVTDISHAMEQDYDGKAVLNDLKATFAELDRIAKLSGRKKIEVLKTRRPEMQKTLEICLSAKSCDQIIKFAESKQVEAPEDLVTELSLLMKAHNMEFAAQPSDDGVMRRGTVRAIAGAMNEKYDGSSILFALQSAFSSFNIDRYTALPKLQLLKMLIKEKTETIDTCLSASSVLKQIVGYGQNSKKEPSDDLVKELSLAMKIRAIRFAGLYAHTDDLKKLINGETELKALLTDALDEEDLSYAFKEKLSLLKVHEDGVPDGVLEWILVANGILKPQQLTKDQPVRLTVSEKEQLFADYGAKLPEVQRASLDQRDDLRSVFETLYEIRFELLDVSHSLNKVFWIQVPELISRIFGSSLIQFGVRWKLSRFWNTKITPILIKELKGHVTQIVNYSIPDRFSSVKAVIKVAQWIYENPKTVCVGVLLIDQVIENKYSKYLKNFAVSNILPRPIQSFFYFFYVRDAYVGAGSLISSAMKKTSSVFANLAQHNKRYYFKHNKEKAFQAWLDEVKKKHAVYVPNGYTGQA